MRIGVIGHTFVNWAGGLDFVRTVAASLRATGEPHELHLLLPIDGPMFAARTRLRAWRDILLARKVAAQPGAHTIAAAVASFGDGITVHAIDIGHRALHRAATRLQLDVVLPAIKPLPFGPDLPWVGYVYDFQHRHLSQFFKPRSAARRERAFVQMLDRAPAVIVNARAVVDDIRRFVPQAKAAVFALPFSADPHPTWFDTDPQAAQQRHGISAPYFIVCNQFWQHKDHRTALRALALLASDRAHLVCTGETSDFRDMNYFPSLMKEARALGISERLHVLGLLPKAEQIALLRGAIALVQPTLFEGGPGGGAAFDAVSLGVPAILSDIAVNREIDEPGVTFFRTGDATDLAAQMRLSLLAAPIERPAPQILLARGHERRAQAGGVLLQAIAAARTAAGVAR